MAVEKRQRISSEANLTISDLPVDVLEQILIRGIANPRSACRCKLVCKWWSSLISSPRFNRSFVLHHQTKNHAPMPENPYELQSIILSFLPPMPRKVRDHFRVLDCNNDLVLCGFWDSDYKSGESSRAYFVCNPFTNQWIALPLAPNKYRRYMTPASRLVCEPRISIKLDLGDGQAFMYSEHRFRVVCIYKEQNIKLDVFCSESGEWTKEAFVLDHSLFVVFAQRFVVSCNGELFWKYCQGHTENEYSLLVARFNPFRLDMPPTFIDVSAFDAKDGGTFPNRKVSCT